MDLSFKKPTSEKTDVRRKHSSEFLRDLKSLSLEIVLIATVVLAVYCFF